MGLHALFKSGEVFCLCSVFRIPESSARARARAHPDRFRLRIDNLHTICCAHMHGSGGLEFNNCARQRFSLHGVDLTKFDGGGARDEEVIPSTPLPWLAAADRDPTAVLHSDGPYFTRTVVSLEGHSGIPTSLGRTKKPPFLCRRQLSSAEPHHHKCFTASSRGGSASHRTASVRESARGHMVSWSRPER